MSTNAPGVLPSFKEAQSYLEGFINYERVRDYEPGKNDFGTRRIEKLLAGLGNPHKTAPAIHIAGTKGKGSVSILTARLLSKKGYTVGLYTSPHLSSICERIAVDGRPITEEAFCEAVALVQPVADAMRAAGDSPTYFETLTATAFAAFREAGVNINVIETGLGGRLDATNIHDLPVVVSGITPISLDHTKQLGNTLLAIAGEKAGILRPETAAVFAQQEKGVAAFLQKRARELGLTVRTVGADTGATLREAPPAHAPEAPQRLDVRTWRSLHKDIPLPLLGDHQRLNAAVALGLAEQFLEWDETGPLDTATIRNAWRTVNIPARLEIIDRKPWLMVDGAHNPASAWVLSETIAERFPGLDTTILLAVNSDKDYRTILKIIANSANRFVLTGNGNPRSLPPGDLLEALAEVSAAKAITEDDPLKALLLARELTPESGLLVVAGSLYLAGIARDACLNG